MCRLIYIVGTPRSGTTLIQQQLLTSIGAVSAPETHFYSRLFNRNFLKKSFYKKHEILHDVAQKLDLSYEGSVGRFNTSSVVKAYYELVCEACRKYEVDCFIEKTPIHLHFVDKIKKMDGSCKFLHVIRNPYENVRSFYYAANRNPEIWGGQKSIDQIVRRYVKDRKVHDRYVGNSSHVYVSYERLIEGEVKVQQIVRLLGENYCPRDVDTSIVIEDFESWKNNNRHNISSDLPKDDYDGFLDEDLFYKSYSYLNKYRQ